MLKTSRIFLSLSLALLTFIQPGYTTSPYYLQFTVYLHTPQVFADRRLGAMPTDKKIPIPVTAKDLWYLRFPGHRPQMPFPEIAKLVQDRKVPGLSFQNNRDVMDVDVQALKGLRDLKYLNLRGTRVTDKSLDALFDMRDLRALIVNDQVSDRGLGVISRFFHLRELVLDGSRITDPGMALLKGQKELQHLDIAGTPVTDAGLNAVSALPLTHVRLGPQITDTGLQVFKKIATLQQIDLGQTQVTDAGLQHLSGLPRLHTLFLNGKLSDKGLQSIAKIASMRRLDLTGSKISDAGSKALTQMKDLEELALSQTSVGDVSIESVLSLKKLRFLEISDTQVSVKGLQRLADLASLEVISFSSKEPVKAETLNVWGKLPKLRTVIINGIPMKPDWMSVMRKQSSDNWLRLLIQEVEAAELPEDTIEIAQLKDRSRSGVQSSGLRRIHEVESSLDNVISAPSMIGVDNMQETEQNFLGEITIDAGKVNIQR
jgi:hypothetical protein